MALPIINESSWYENEVPSTKQKITYRPFLVKEQKILLIASESQDRKQIMNAICDTISACVKEEIDFRKLPTFDVDYIFSQIRGKSVGESSEIIIKCKKCEGDNKVSVDITKAEIKGTFKEKVVKITDDISVEMVYPSYHSMANKLGSLDDNSSDGAAIFDILSACINAVLTNDEKILISEEPKEEVDRFIESLTSEQFNKISEFVTNFPKLSMEVNFVCEHCAENNTVTLEGLEDFF